MILINSGGQSDCSVCNPKYEGRFTYIEAEEGELFAVGEKGKNYIIFIIAGYFSVCVNQFKDCLINPGEMIYLPKSSDCEGKALSNVKLIVLTVDVVLLPCISEEGGKLYRVTTDSDYIFGGVAINRQMNDYVCQLYEYIHRGLRCVQMHEIKLKEFFLILKHFYSKEEKIRLFYYSLGRNLSFSGEVHKYFRQVKTSRELASRMGYSEKTFERHFRECFGTSPYKWMQTQTANLIKGKLMDPTIPLKQIMYEFNFTTSSHFNSYCKRMLGTSPGMYRKLNTSRR